MLDLAAHRIAVTGSAGFIGFHVTRTLLEMGLEVHSFDAVNDYYDVRLKESRLKALGGNKNHHFHKGFLENKDDMAAFFAAAKPDIVIHLAAQAGVRYSLTHPQAYIDSNIQGFQNILDSCRTHDVKHLVYASSSSVYGANGKLPFSEGDAVEHPLSLYAATKKTNELMAHSFSNIFGLPTTGLRFFTVYGPWGRPDMAMFLFTKAILENRPIDVFNHGRMRRDFTYVDDIVQGVLGAARNPPAANDAWDTLKADPSCSRAPWRVFNLGNHRPTELGYLIELIEKELGRPAQKNLLPLQPGDVPETYADIDRARNVFGFSPATPVETGVREFIRWYRDYYGV